MLQTITINNYEIPLIITEATNTDKNTLIATKGMINIHHGKKDPRTLRTVISGIVDEILRIYLSLETPMVMRTKEEYLAVCQKYIEKYQKILDIIPDKIRQTEMRLDHLGYAYKNNSITLNAHMQYMSEEVIEYTICHEFCHLYTLHNYRTFKHDEDFYNTLRQFYSEEEEIRIHSS